MIRAVTLLKFLFIICSVTGNPTPKEESLRTYFDYTVGTTRIDTREFAGLHQSPIDFNTDEVNDTNYTKFTFENYDLIFPESLKNNGHSFELEIDSVDKEDLPSISSGGLTDRYRFVQLHFHWGEGLLGSEHLINGKKYAAELHIVHYNTKYGDFKMALPHWDGLAVLGIFIELQTRDNTVFRKLLEPFDNIIDPSTNISDPLRFSIPLADLLPDSTESFFRYNGSLTTHGCNEDVIWTVFDTPIAISRRQLAKFRQLNDENGRPIDNNVRPTQPLNDRVVNYRPDPTPYQPLFSFPDLVNFNLSEPKSNNLISNSILI